MLNAAWAHRIKIYLIAITGIICSVFFCKPHNNPIVEVYNSHSKHKFDLLMIKKNDLTNNLRMYKPDSHEGKGVFRITVPVLMKVLQINTMPELYFLQVLAGILMYFLIAAVAFKSTGSYRISLVLTVALSATYFGRSYFLDTYPWLDTFAYCLTMLAIWSRNPFIIILAIVGMFFTDERGAVSAGIVFLSLKLLDLNRAEDVSFKNLFSFKGISNYVWIGFAICVIIRLLLTYGYGMSSPLNGVGKVFSLQWKTVQLGLFDGLAGIWGIFAMATLHAVLNRKYLFAAINIGTILLFILISVNVMDVTRSIAYLIPFVFISGKYLHDNMADIGYTFAGIAFINVLYPHGFVIKDWIFNNTGYPILFDIFFKIKNILGL